MSVRNIILVLLAVAITAGTGLVARSWLNSQRAQVAAPAAPPPEEKKTYVLVADKDLPTGAFLKENLLTWQSWPDKKLHPNYLIKGQDDIADLEGGVVRRSITAGEPITTGRVIKPGSRGFLAAVLRPGYRAISLRVNATSSIAGLVFPGDRVDVLLTHQVRNDGQKRRVTETALTNVRVLAIDQKTNDQENAPKVGKNATFEVTPKQAEMLSVLSELGRLSLSLRSLAKDQAELELIANSLEPLAEPDPAKGVTHTWDTEVSRLIRRPSGGNQQKVQVVRGMATTELRFDRNQLVESITLDTGPATSGMAGSSGSDDTIRLEMKLPKPPTDNNEEQESETSSAEEKE